MIARIWHGKTAKRYFDDYMTFLKERAIPDYSSIEGNMGITFLRRLEKDEAHFTLITYWDSIEAIKKFAGEEFDKAKYYPEDLQYLLEFEERVVHHEVFYDHKNVK
jgi:heme-degrading monooxygenase HmoA